MKPGDLARAGWFAGWRAVERLLYHRRYTVQVPTGYRLFTPWFDPTDRSPFSDGYRVARAGGPMIVTPDRCYILAAFAGHAARLPGEMAECGVYQGGTAQLLAETIRGTRRTLHLFDSFAGMPDSAQPDRDYHGPGEFADTSLAAVTRRLAGYDYVRLHPGFLPGTFAELDPAARFSFAHLDLDIYPSTLAACEWLWPRMVPGGVMVFDDYGYFHLRHGAKAAVDEYFADRAEKPIVLPTGQAIVLA